MSPPTLMAVSTLVVFYFLTLCPDLSQSQSTSTTTTAFTNSQQGSALTTVSLTDSRTAASTKELTTTMMNHQDSLDVGAVVGPIVAIVAVLIVVVVVVLLLWKRHTKKTERIENENDFDERNSEQVVINDQKPPPAAEDSFFRALEPLLKPHFHDVSRKDAEKLLEGCAPGSFVITSRSSSTDPDDGAVCARFIVTYVCPQRLDVHHVGVSYHTVNAMYSTVFAGTRTPPTRSLVQLLRQARLNVDSDVRDHYAKISNIQSSQPSHYEELTSIEVGFAASDVAEPIIQAK